MPDPTWAEIDKIGLQILDACRDGQARAIGRIDVRHPAEVIRVAVGQLVDAGLLSPHFNKTGTTYTITPAGRSHLATQKVGA